MGVTVSPPAADTLERPVIAAPDGAPRLADGLELLGEVHGSGYREGAALVRRADGQMVHVGPLMHAFLAALDGARDAPAIAEAMSASLGRPVEAEHVQRLVEKAGEQGFVAGTEHRAPPRRNPLLALRWKVLVTNPVWTRRLTAPFTVFFRPWLMWPILAAFVAVCWFVLVHKGIASATAEAFHRPELLLLVFVLGIASAAFHEIGHASACRYGGAHPGGMGMGIYMVWPAFYTDVTDAYRLPRRARLRVDLGGLYFNAVVAVATMGAWLATRTDALLLLIGLQLLQMVKQLSPVIRADGYHILADATGVPDLYAHIGPTVRRLLPSRRRRAPSPLHGKARALVTAWVLIVVPVLLSLTVSAVLLFPRLATTAWQSGRLIGEAAGHEFGGGNVIGGLADCVRLLALVLPVLGTALVSQRILRTITTKADAWSDGRPGRRAFVVGTAVFALTATAWALWPSGQYQAIGAGDRGTVGGMLRAVSAPASVARPQPQASVVHLSPGTHIAVSLIPVGGATERHPAVFVIKGKDGEPAAVIVSRSSPDPAKASAAAAAAPGAPATTSTAPASAPPPSANGAQAVTATAFPFQLPSAPRPGDSQALAVNTKDGSTKYVVAYSLVTVRDGAPVTNANSAYAFANCNACTTVAVSVQVVLIVGTSRVIAPVDVAGALNGNCPSCITTAIADQIVVTLKSEPPAQLVQRLQADLQRLNALPGESPAQVAQDVADVQKAIDSDLDASGLRANGTTTSTTSTGAAPPASTTPTTTTTTPSSTTTQTSTTPTQTTTTGDQTTTPTSTTPTSTTTTQTTPTTTTQTTTTPQSTGTTTTPTQTSTTTTPTTTTTTP